jgi:hypothetical protein
MTGKVIALEFVVPLVLAIALSVALSIGAVYLIEKYLSPADQAEICCTVIALADPGQ